MGSWKDKLIEQQERGWDSVGLKFVCGKCVDDYALKEFVIDNAVTEDCSYCGQSCKDKPLTIGVDDLIEYVVDGIEVEWQDPLDGVIWDSAEGGWQGVDVFDTWDLLSGEVENPFNRHDLFADVASAIQHEWCQKDFAMLKPEEAMFYGWQEFSRTVKHHTRHVFSMAIEEDDENFGPKEIPTPAEFLAELGELITKVGLVTTLPATTQILRGRAHPKLETYSWHRH